MTATRGPQVVLEGYARDVARGGAGRTMRANIAAMDQLISAGLVADGNAVDGTSRSGGKAYDAVVAQFPDEPLSAWEVPAPLLTINASTSPVIATGGTAPRTLADRFGQVIDIRDLGAACDGVTDDTAAWALAFTKPNGTVIRIPQNCVTMVGNAFLQSNFKAISIIGDGKSSVIRMLPGTLFTHPLFSWGGGASNVRVESLTVDLNNNPQPATVQLIFNFTGLQGVVLRNVAMINASINLYLANFNNCHDVTVDGCYFQATAGSSAVQSKGITFASSLGTCSLIRVVHNILINTNIECGGVDQIYIAGNDISGWGVGAGIGLDAGSGSTLATIIGNKCHDSLTAQDMYGFNCNGIECWSATAVIANNECWNCCGAGIFVGGANCMIVGNACWDNNTFSGTPVINAGIAMGVSGSNNSSGSVLIGNNCYDSGVNRQNYGFRINNTGITGLVLNANRFSGYQGDTFQMGVAAFLNNVEYTPRVLAADPTLALGAATKQYVDARTTSGLLYQTTTSVGNGADTTADVLQTYTLPANTLLNIGDRIIIRAAGSFIGSTDSKTVSVTWGGGTSILNIVGSVASAVGWKLEGEFIKTASGVQTYSMMGITNNNTTATGTTSLTRTDTAAIVINIQGQNATNATANSIVCRYFTVDYLRAV